jgi:hypothetical protein
MVMSRSSEVGQCIPRLSIDLLRDLSLEPSAAKQQWLKKLSVTQKELGHFCMALARDLNERKTLPIRQAMTLLSVTYRALDIAAVQCPSMGHALPVVRELDQHEESAFEDRGDSEPFDFLYDSLADRQPHLSLYLDTYVEIHDIPRDRQDGIIGPAVFIYDAFERQVSTDRMIEAFGWSA